MVELASLLRSLLLVAVVVAAVAAVAAAGVVEVAAAVLEVAEVAAGVGGPVGSVVLEFEVVGQLLLLLLRLVVAAAGVVVAAAGVVAAAAGAAVAAADVAGVHVVVAELRLFGDFEVAGGSSGLVGLDLRCGPRNSASAAWLGVAIERIHVSFCASLSRSME